LLFTRVATLSSYTSIAIIAMTFMTPSVQAQEALL
jgi:hypothetical protein